MTKFPRALFSFQVRAADLAIIALFSLGSWAGFPGFAKLSEIKTQIASLQHQPAWACLLFLFNYLVLYRKLGKAYFSIWVAAVHAALVVALITLVLVGVAKFSLLSTMNWFDAAIAIQCGMAAVLLLVQNWVDFQSDIRGLGELSRKIDAEARRLEDLSGTVIKKDDLKKAGDMCSKFVRDADVALSENLNDATFRLRLTEEKKKVEAIAAALKGLLSDVPEALKRHRQAIEKEEVSHA